MYLQGDWSQSPFSEGRKRPVLISQPQIRHQATTTSTQPRGNHLHLHFYLRLPCTAYASSIIQPPEALSRSYPDCGIKDQHTMKTTVKLVHRWLPPFLLLNSLALLALAVLALMQIKSEEPL